MWYNCENNNKQSTFVIYFISNNIYRHVKALFNSLFPTKSDCYFNSLWPSGVIWRQGSRSTLAQVMACCLTAPSHYLNQCWLMISEVLWHSPDSNFTENTSDIYRWNDQTVVKFPRGQWVKTFFFSCVPIDNDPGWDHVMAWCRYWARSKSSSDAMGLQWVNL